MRMADAAAARTRISLPERLALLLASLCHDMHHPGVSNAYLMNARAPVAALYNDTSVLEHAAAAGAYALASKLGSSGVAAAGGGASSSSSSSSSSAAAAAAAAGDVFAALDPASWKEVRRLFIAAVLHTDMTYHFPMVSKVEVFYELNAAAISRANAAEANAAAAGGGGGGAGGGSFFVVGGRGSSAARAAAAAALAAAAASAAAAAAAATAAAAAAATSSAAAPSSASSDGGGAAAAASTPGGARRNSAAATAAPASPPPSLLFATAEERPFLVAILLHCADISNAAKPRRITEQWAHRVLAEFFAQGDAERAAGLPVSPLCERASTSLPGSQGNFIEFVVAPLFHQAARVFPGLAPLMGHVLDNRRAWHAELARELEAGTGPAGARGAAERAAELARAATRVEAFEKAYGHWGAVAEAAASAAAAAVENAAAAASGGSSSDGSSRGGIMTGGGGGGGGGAADPTSSSRRRSNSFQNVLGGAFSSRGRSRSGSGSNILGGELTAGKVQGGGRGGGGGGGGGGGSGGSSFSRMLARGTIFGGGGGGGSNSGNNSAADASSFSSASAVSDRALRRVRSISMGAQKNKDPLSSAERGGK